MVLLEILKHSQEYTCAIAFFIKVAGHRCFPVNFAKFLRIPFLTEHINDFIFPFLVKRKAYKFSKEYY